MLPRLLLFISATFITVSAVTAGPFSVYQDEQERASLGARENCGAQPAKPSVLGSIVNAAAHKRAEESYSACLERNQRRDYLKGKSEGQAIVDRARDSCQNSVRRLSAAPSTLSFENGKDFEFIYGFNGSGIDRTEGGYSVKLSGSDVQGPFHVTCYLDKSFRVTNVK